MKVPITGTGAGGVLNFLKLGKLIGIKSNDFNYLYYFCSQLIKRIKHTVLKNKQMSHLTIEKKAKIFSEFGGKATNTGSIEGQVALLTERINHISDHLKTNKKDFSSQRGLMMMVGQRKRLLSYLSKHNLAGYRALIEKLGLRK